MIVRTAHSQLVVALAAAFLLCAVPAAAQEKPESLPSTQPIPASQQVPAPGGTISSTIHPGDVLSVAVYGHPDLTQLAVVQADGTIQFPLVQRVFVGGMSPADARDALSKALLKYVKRPIVSLAIQQQGAMTVTVLGNAKTPGKFTLRSGSHLTDAIAAAGGVATMNGDYPPARVTQSDGGITTISLQKLIHDGDGAQNVELADNAIVYVTGGETFRVQVLGAVTRPGNVEVNEGDRLSMALARAGAEAASKPDLNRVYLTRVDPQTGKTTPSYEINLYQALQKGDQRYDPILRKDDKIYVPEAKQISPATIGILGVLGRILGF